MTEDDSGHDGIARFYTEYLARFNCSDLAGMMSFLVFPFVMIVGDGATAYPDEQSAMALYEKMYADMRATGWCRSSVDRLDITRAGGNGAMLIPTVARHGADGSVIARGKACYALERQRDGSWRIAALIASFRSDFVVD